MVIKHVNLHYTSVLWSTLGYVCQIVLDHPLQMRYTSFVHHKNERWYLMWTAVPKYSDATEQRSRQTNKIWRQVVGVHATVRLPLGTRGGLQEGQSGNNDVWCGMYMWDMYIGLLISAQMFKSAIPRTEISDSDFVWKKTCLRSMVSWYYLFDLQIQVHFWYLQGFRSSLPEETEIHWC